MSFYPKIDNKTSRKKSRTRKALSTGMLLYHAIREGMTIQFSKTRKSFYAMKVLRGNSILHENQKYDMNLLMEISEKFMKMMETIIQTKKSFEPSNYIIDKETVEEYEMQQIALPKQQLMNINENDTRNKEAAFSNTLAWLLIQRNYKLHYKTYNKKQSFRVINFYVWEGISSPNGNYYQVEDNDFIAQLIDCINKQLDVINVLDVDKSFFSQPELSNHPFLQSELNNNLNNVTNNEIQQNHSVNSMQLMNRKRNDFDDDIQQIEMNTVSQKRNIWLSCFTPVVDYSNYEIIFGENHSVDD